jgi:hypothetical protein
MLAVAVSTKTHETIFMILSDLTLISLALVVYSLTTRYEFKLTGGLIFVLLGLLIGYEIFLIVTNLVYWEMLVITFGLLFFGFWLLRTSQSIITIQGITDELEDPNIAAILIYFETLIFPIRVIQAWTAKPPLEAL